MNTQELLTDLTPQEEEKICGGYLPWTILAAVATVGGSVQAAYAFGQYLGNQKWFFLKGLTIKGRQIIAPGAVY